MPLFRVAGGCGAGKSGRRRVKTMKWRDGSRRTDDDGSVQSLTRLCLVSLADNMKEVWVKDYAEKYLDQYLFRHIMGPFNSLPGDLVEELIHLLSSRKKLSRPALHLLMVPQLKSLLLEKCPGLLTSSLCVHIAARCQGLWNLDLSGAQQLPSKVLSKTLCSLPALRSLSLAGTPCDECVIRTIFLHCRFLRHLDVTRCHFLPPAALLSLVGRAFCSSSACPSSSTLSCSTSATEPSTSSCTVDHSSPISSASLPPLPLSSILALDIGFGEEEGDSVTVAAYLLLSLPSLKALAIEGLAQACSLIEHRDFSKTEEFSEREKFPRLIEVWRKEKHRQNSERTMERQVAEDEEHEDDEEDEIMWVEYSQENDGDENVEEGPSCSLIQAQREPSSSSSDERLILHLKDVKGITCDFLDSLCHLCPDINNISVSIEEPEDTRQRSQCSVLAAGLQTWSGQLQSLSILYPGLLHNLLPALHVTGSTLLSLTLEGVKNIDVALLTVMHACPKLHELLVFAEPPTVRQINVVERQDDNPQLPNLRTLTISFSHNPIHKNPAILGTCFTKVLDCLLKGSPLLEKVSLVSLPGRLNSTLNYVLQGRFFNFFHIPGFSNSHLKLLKHINLTRTDVMMGTVIHLMSHCKRLRFVDLSHCWEISQSELQRCTMFRNVEVVYV